MMGQNLTPAEVARWLAERAILLVDVREPDEFALERIPGALLFPLSSFDAAALQAVGDHKIVFQCGSGLRSAKALAAALDAGLDCAGHVVGGIKAWKDAGLPVIAVDPGTGKLRGTH
jgi:rhodanese-related sulfurtransferase